MEKIRKWLSRPDNKVLVAIIVIGVLMLAVVLVETILDNTGAGFNTTEKEVESTSIDKEIIENYEGEYENSTQGRASVKLANDGTMKVFIVFGDTQEWNLKGKFDAETGVLEYSNGVKTQRKYKEDSDGQKHVESSEVVHDDGTGRLTFKREEGVSSFIFEPDKDYTIAVKDPFKRVEDLTEPKRTEVPLSECNIWDFEGGYGNGRGGISIEADEKNNLTATIHWSSSAGEWSDWTMSGPFDISKGVFKYSDCVKTETVASDEGKNKSKEAYKNGTGKFIFKREKVTDRATKEESYETTLIWEDDMEDAGKDTTWVRPDVNSGFEIGEAYYVQYNGVKVRNEPSTRTDKSILKKEQIPDQYQADLIDSSQDAMLKKGTEVHCYDVKGNWIQIAEGCWVCVNDGDVLVSSTEPIRKEDLAGLWVGPKEVIPNVDYAQSFILNKDGTMSGWTKANETYTEVRLFTGAWELNGEEIIMNFEGTKHIFELVVDERGLVSKTGEAVGRTIRMEGDYGFGTYSWWYNE